MLKVRRPLLGHTITCKQCGHNFEAALAAQPGPNHTAALPTGDSHHAWPEVERVLVTCENCQASLSVKRSKIGQVIRCKQCDSELLVTPPGEATPLPTVGAFAASAAGVAVKAVAVSKKSDLQLEQLQSKHDSLQAEFEKLSVAQNLLEAEANRIRLERTEILAEKDRICQQRNDLAAELSAVSDTFARADMEKEAALRQLEQRGAEADRDRVTLRSEIERLEGLLEIERVHHQEEVQHRADADRDRASYQSEIARLEELKQSALVELDQYRAATDHDQANYQAEIEGLKQTLESMELTCTEYERRNSELDLTQTRLVADLESKFESERLGRVQLQEQYSALKHESASLKESLAQLSADRQADPEASASEPVDQETELESARAEIARLRYQVEELKRLPGEITSVLHGLGLRVDVG
jgi:hypothetical protein